MRAFSEVEAHVLQRADDGGAWVMSSADDQRPLRIIASDGLGWDHVSVSRSDRCPTWSEMEQVKRAFFRDNETALQFHVPPSDHRSYHPFCLHLWRPQHAAIPRPNAELVAPVSR